MQKNGRTKINIRRNKILEILHKEKKVYIADLSQLLGASLVTIRSDLDVLAEQGQLIRMAGGAVLPNEETSPTFSPINNREAKQEIATTVAELIQDGSTLFINSGTTTLLVAESLKTKKNLSIVTNSVPIATLLGKVPTFRIILLGGTINTQYAFTYGTDTQEQLNRYGADWAILSVDGVSPDGDISTCHAEEAIIDRLMITRAKKVLIVADSTKIGRTGFSYVSRCDNKIKILTNKK
ncbi:MAG: DeoR/GlpR transcriptional regulator [Clostridiales bacterium]|nr:DeoR/GlpR transcriptional regulator [Clostridiales bacterium]